MTTYELNGIIYDLNPEFQEALRTLMSGRNMFVSGSGGVGKSTFVRIIEDIYKEKGKDIIKLGPTGISAVNIGGQTIHSFFKFRIGPLTFSNAETALNNKQFLDIVERADLLIIDEISMVRPDIFEMMNHVLQQAIDPNRAFGGKQLLIVGDLFQLPPIIKDKNDERFLLDMYGGTYFFQTNSYKDADFKCIEFSKCYRQQDAEFIGYLNRIRQGDGSQKVLDYFNKAVIEESLFEERVGNNYVSLVATNKRKDDINSTFLGCLEEEEHKFPAEVVGDVKSTDSLMDFDLRLKVGAQVMSIKNTPDGIYNGMIGIIEGFNNTYIDEVYQEVVRVNFDGRIRNIGRYREEKIKYGYNVDTKDINSHVAGTITQFPLVLAWCRTIHKSQSATFDKVYIEFSKSFYTAGMIYTALSRCRSYEGLGLARPIEEKHCKVDKTVLSFYNKAFAELPVEVADVV